MTFSCALYAVIAGIYAWVFWINLRRLLAPKLQPGKTHKFLVGFTVMYGLWFVWFFANSIKYYKGL